MNLRILNLQKYIALVENETSGDHLFALASFGNLSSIIRNSCYDHRKYDLALLLSWPSYLSLAMSKDNIAIRTYIPFSICRK